MLENTKLTGFADEIHSDLKIQIRLLKELDMKYLELRSADGKNISEYSPDEAKRLKKQLDDNQLKVSAIGSPIGKIQITEPFEQHFDVYKNVVEMAKIMETPYIRIFSFYIPKNELPEKYQDEVFSRFEKMLAYAEKHNVMLLHENEKDIYGDIAPRCSVLLNHFQSKSFRCIFDFANFIQCGQDTMKAYELLQPAIEYIHIKDAYFSSGKVVPAGDGDGNIKTILSKLDKSGYSGFLSLEPHLADFAGLKSLEQNAQHRGQTDGEAAFCIAHQALTRLLKSEF